MQRCHDDTRVTVIWGWIIPFKMTKLLVWLRNSRCKINVNWNQTKYINKNYYLNDKITLVCVRQWWSETPANRRPFMPWGTWQLSDVSKKGRTEGGTGAVCYMTHGVLWLEEAGGRKDGGGADERQGIFLTEMTLLILRYFFPIIAGHIMHSEAIRSVISWWSLQDILTCTVLKEGVNHSRQTKPNLTATLYVCRGSAGFKDEFKTSGRRRNLW